MGDQAFPETLYVTEAEIADRLGVSSRSWRRTSKRLVRMGFPPRNPLFCNRRYWPAIQAFLDSHEGLKSEFALVGDSADGDGEESWRN